jgi:DNA-binding beta-propeller fold protein YncE
MFAHGKSNRTPMFWLLVLSAVALASAAPAYAQKKPAPAAPTKLADQRSKAYFDVSKIVWPNPPAIARIKFVDLFTGQKVDPNLFTNKNKKAKQKWMDRLAGTPQTDEIQIKDLPFQLIRTYGLAVDSKGQIYAADQGVSAVFIFNAETKNVELIGNGKQAHFGTISGLAIDDTDRLFVTDVGLHRVDVFSPTHELLTAFGGDVLSNPSSVAIDNENRFVYVVDTQNDVVDVFDADTFKLLRKIGTPGKKHTLTAPGTFSLPQGVAVDHDGNVYVTDTLNNRIEIFDPDGGFISTFGKNGDGPQDFERPKGIAVDCDGHIWVADAAQDRVKVFSREGQLLIYFGTHGEYPGRFMGVHDITIDKNNRVITSEIFPGRVQIFRYVTDAEAEAEKKLREGEGETKPAAAPSPKAPAEPPTAPPKDGTAK